MLIRERTKLIQGLINQIFKKMTVDVITKAKTKSVIIKFDLFFIFKIPGW